jgi:hypothetical protein
VNVSQKIFSVIKNVLAINAAIILILKINAKKQGKLFYKKIPTPLQTNLS